MDKRISNPMDDSCVGELYEQFLNECMVYNKSPATLFSYRASMNMLYNVMEGIEKKSISKLSKAFSVSYVLALSKRQVSAATINHYLREFRAFVYWCMENEYLAPYKVKLVKENEHLKTSYTKDELWDLVFRPQHDASFVEWRTWAMINWMLSLGSRSETVLNVMKEDINFTENTILTRHNKNGKIKTFPLNAGLKLALLEYRHHIPDDTDYFFPSVEGEKLEYGGFRTAIRKYNKSRGVDKASIHLFRHTFGKLWAENGGSVYELQAIFGHSDIRTTQGYINLYGDKLEPDRMARLNPLETLTKQKNR